MEEGSAARTLHPSVLCGDVLARTVDLHRLKTNTAFSSLSFSSSLSASTMASTQQRKGSAGLSHHVAVVLSSRLCQLCVDHATRDERMQLLSDLLDGAQVGLATLAQRSGRVSLGCLPILLFPFAHRRHCRCRLAQQLVHH